MDNLLLAIDDEPAILDIIDRVARQSGYCVTVTSQPSCFKTAVVAEPPHLIFLDLQMPDCDGVELLRYLAERACRAKIILMSGFDARVLNVACSLGAELGLDMGKPLQKPVRPAALRELLAQFRAKSFQPDAEAVREALKGEQFTLYYQPLIELATRRTAGLESLVRWQHPEFGLVMPSRFIDLCEREALIDDLTERVLSLAIRQLADWRQAGFDRFVSVNLSASNIKDARFPDRLANLCAANQVPPSQICLELTETAAMTNPMLTQEVLTRLRLKGFKLAIDDYGTGYSSLQYLHRIPFSELKIDQSFVRAMERSEDARVIVGAVAQLGKALKLELVAEGIESHDAARRLMAFGYDIGQGFYFSRPMPADLVMDWIGRQDAAPHHDAA